MTVLSMGCYHHCLTDGVKLYCNYFCSIEPEAVVMFEAASIQTDSVRLEWTVSEQSVQDHFAIEYQGIETDKAWRPLPNVDETERTLDVTGLRPGDQFTFKITARSKDQTSASKTTTVATCKLLHMLVHS